MANKKIVIKINRGANEAIKEEVSRPVMVTEWHVGRIISAILILSLALLTIGYFFLSSEEESQDIIPATTSTQISPGDISMPVEIAEEDDNNGDSLRNSTITNKQTISNDAINKSEQESSQPTLPYSPVGIKDSIQESNKKSNSQPTDENENKTELTEVLKKDEKRDQKPDNYSTIYDQHVSRALLASRIVNKEPSGKLSSPIVVDNDKAVSVFYFTEINNMKGQVLYHHWILNGKTRFKRKINILGKRWRATTSKNINYRQKGHWLVKLTDKDGNILSVVTFDVI